MPKNNPMVFIIFGATGDLSQQKLLPALYSLYAKKILSPQTYILGVSRREITITEFREFVRVAVQSKNPAAFDLDAWGYFTDGIDYESGLFEDPDLYRRISARLSSYDKVLRACVPRLFYLATAPDHYAPILKNLKNSSLSEGCGQGTDSYTRILIEKPFGRDLATAYSLEKTLSDTFSEQQIFRIDHYLGKETVQNILAFRFGNGIFEPTWNRRFIDHVQITLAETVGVGTRGAFYDGIGALRDVVQNHMLEMLALTAMEQPKAFTAEEIRNERVSALKSIRCLSPGDVDNNVVRGQYGASEKTTAYLSENNVPKDSQTETFVALKLFVKNDRWDGVPFYLRTGKRLERKTTEISLHYKKPELCKGDNCFFPPDEVFRNVLSLKIQPDEGIDLRLMAKEPGFGMHLAPSNLTFRYDSGFTGLSQTDEYERLLLDAAAGDQTLFARTDGIEASWQFLTAIREAWIDGTPPLLTYQPGSWGPAEANELIERDGRRWM